MGQTAKGLDKDTKKGHCTATMTKQAGDTTMHGLVADDGDGGARVSRAASVERGGAVVITETLQGEREPKPFESAQTLLLRQRRWLLNQQARVRCLHCCYTRSGTSSPT